ncbi:MAG: hypothetical protein ACLQL2_06430 [Methylovirgula sp.]
MNFDLIPSRDDKVEFPATAEGYLRRIVFYAAATLAALCGVAIVGSVGVALVSAAIKLLHPH